MNVVRTPLDEVLVVEIAVHRDERGYFLESWQEDRYAAFGIKGPFVQDNHSHSRRGVLRGLHYQEPMSQGKLVSVLHGRVFDVAVDIRRDSPRFGRWSGVELSDTNHRQLWIPPGFAHGFLTLSDEADLIYKCTEAYAPHCERTIRWDDPEIGIEWPDCGLEGPLLSPKDAAAGSLAKAKLPAYSDSGQ